MKTLTQYLTEGKDQYIIDECNAKGNKKMGFVYYDENSATVQVIQFDDLESFAEAQGFDVEDYMGIDKLKVGESAYDGAAAIYVRIW